MPALRRWFGALLFGAVVLLAGAGGGQAQEIDLGADVGVDQLSDWIAEGGTAADLRRACADRLIEEAVSRERGASRAVASLLSGDAPVHARRAVLLAIARSERAHEITSLADGLVAMRAGLPVELEDVWAQTLGRFEVRGAAEQLAKVAGDEQLPMDQRRLAIRGLGEHRRLFAAEMLMALTSVNRLPQVQGWAYEAMGNLSHQDTLGQDRAAWAKWYNQASDLNTTGWQRMLHENLLNQIRSQQETEDRVLDRLIQTQRDLHRATPDEQKPAFLVGLMQDELEASRLLAMDLVRQRAEDGGAFGALLREELRVRLGDPLAKVREESATLLGQLLDAKAADVIAGRLASGEEGQASVERAYLIALTQMPREQALAPAYEMLANPQLQVQAAGLLAASRRAGLGEEAFWGGVLSRVRTLLDEVDSPNAQAVTLFGLVLKEEADRDWQRIAGWLDVEDDSVREAAARVWAGSTRPLLGLAQRSDDPVIRPIALRAIAERGGGEESLKALAERRPDEAEDVRLWEQALVALAGRVDPASLLEVLNRLALSPGETRQVRQRMLTAAIDVSADEDPPSRERLSLLLARARVRVLTDAPALVCLDYEAALQHAEQLSDAQRYNARKGLALAYFADARVDDMVRLIELLFVPEGALVSDANKSPLLAELIEVARQAIEQGRVSDAAQLIGSLRAIFGQALSEANAERLSNLEARIEEATPEPATPTEQP